MSLYCPNCGSEVFQGTEANTFYCKTCDALIALSAVLKTKPTITLMAALPSDKAGKKAATTPAPKTTAPSKTSETKAKPKSATKTKVNKNDKPRMAGQTILTWNCGVFFPRAMRPNLPFKHKDMLDVNIQEDGTVLLSKAKPKA